MSDRDQAGLLLQVAERELRALNAMDDVETFSDEVFGFLAQQAVEKALKAWLCALGRAHPFTHDLTDLFSRLEDEGLDMKPFWELADLNPFAVEFRYTNLGFEEVPLNRQEIVTHVRALLARVKNTFQC